MLLDFDNILKKYNMNIKGVIHIGAHYGQEHSLFALQSNQFVPVFHGMLVQEKFGWCKSLLLLLCHGRDKTAIQRIFV